MLKIKSMSCCGEKLKIIWEGDYLLEDGSSIRTATQGCHEMPYGEVVAAVEAFWAQFAEAMERQVENAVEKNGTECSWIKST